jgi:hypothetical protein
MDQLAGLRSTTTRGTYAPSLNYPSGPSGPASGGMSNPALRASDSDRDRILAQLSEHYQAGRLTTAEFDERSGKALSARTLSDLDGLMADLPAGPGDPEPSGTPAPAQPRLARRGFGGPAAAVVAVLAVVAVIALLSHTGHHGSSGGWGFIIPALIIARMFTGRRTRRRDRDRG